MSHEISNVHFSNLRVCIFWLVVVCDILSKTLHFRIDVNIDLVRSQTMQGVCGTCIGKGKTDQFLGQIPAMADSWNLSKKQNTRNR